MFENKLLKVLREAARQKALLLPATLLASSVGCSSMQAAEESTVAALESGEDITIKVYFDGGCPKTVNFLSLTVNRGDQVQWQAVDMTGAESQDKFKVYFHPFAAASISTPPGNNDNPTTPVMTVATQPPANVDYKYTIVGDDCAGDPLDPYLRIL